jgi:hypothetical protein
MMRGFAVLVFAAAASAQVPVPAQGTIVKSKSNITNNIVSEADGRLRCVTAEGKPCTAAQVQEMADLLTAQGGLKTLALASADGTLRCQTADGKACTVSQVGALNQVIVRGWDPQKGKAIVGRPTGKQ